MVPSAFLFGLFAFAVARPPFKRGTGTVKCRIVLDGRVPVDTELFDFDSSATSPFNPDFIRGPEKFSEILLFPDVPNSRFDDESYKSVEVTINDQSVFQSQKGFRRIGLQIQGDENTGGPGTVGVRTLHWSVKQDPARTLNLTHEYLNVWHETSTTGTIIGQSGNENTFKILDRENIEVWSTPINCEEWQNFAVTLDFNKNTLQVYYSIGDAPLEAVTPALSNNNAGQGQYQMGILKKPTGTDDVVNSGFQETGLDEGQIYGGIFLEDSTDGCVSL
ncbi:hypothetical protein DL763_004217 [Monosporascus cannonballus]|nr:hypothetical protein DL763_004217 [Monosporascus cannonballus]